MRIYDIGIDPGVKTGVAVWNREAKKLTALYTVPILVAMSHVLELGAERIHVISVEDAKQRGGPAERAQGAGSVKRDCGIWKEFCEMHGIPYLGTPPIPDGTKWPAAFFKRLTGWENRTSEHSRDAAARVWGGVR